LLRFLIIQKVNHGTPVQKLAKLVPTQMKYIRELKEKRKIEVYYHLIGQEGNMIVCNVDSEEDLSALVGDDPLFFDSHREVYPLISYEKHENRFRKLLV
jgi:muconolactone delta-isomerase